MKSKYSFLISVMLLCACYAYSQNYRLMKVSRCRIVVDSTYDACVDTAAVSFLEPYKHKVDSMMMPVVGVCNSDMSGYRPESPLSNLLADILIYASAKYNEHPVMSVYNIGSIRASLSKGAVTRGDILDVAPFENKICFLTLTGDKLLELFRQIASVHGEGVSHGVKLVISHDGSLISASINGKAIDVSSKYRIATIDFLSQGNDKMVAFKSGTDKIQPSGEENNTRQIIMDYFSDMRGKGVNVDSKVEGRITER